VNGSSSTDRAAPAAPHSADVLDLLSAWAGPAPEAHADVVNDPRHTAVHEAGHAVIGRKLGLHMGQTTAVQENDSAGHSLVGEPYATLDRWWREARHHREFGSVVRARVMMLMAGAEAEIAILGQMQVVDDMTGDGEDRREIERVMESHPGDPAGDTDRLIRMRRATRRLVLRHRADIERVTAELYRLGTISGTDLDLMVPGPPALPSDPMLEALMAAEIGDEPTRITTSSPTATP